MDQNGFFEVKRNPISKVGVFPYSGGSIGAAEKDKVYMVYRPAEELGSPECMESFKLLPFVDEHHMLGKGEVPAEKKGVHGVIGETIEFDGDTLYANIKVFSESLANLIEGGKRELSCGYRCEYEFAPGEHNGVKYDMIQRNIRGNHLALVHEGRMGKEVAVLDSMVFTFDAKEILDMEEEKKVEEQAEELTLEGLAEQIKAIAAVVEKLKPLEEEEHGVSLDEDPEGTKAEDEEPEEKAPAMDAAEFKKEVMREIAQRDALYKKVSNIVGSFDHAEMSIEDVAEYASKKIGLSSKSVEAVEGYIAGAASAKTIQTKAMDSVDNTDKLSYIQGEA